MKVKICGITNKEDAQHAVALGADAIGFIFAKESPRFVTPRDVLEICLELPPFISTVGVFVNESKEAIDDIVEQCKLNLVQLHGDESPEFCMSMTKRVLKAFRIQDIDDIDQIGQYEGMISAALLDTKVEGKSGGTGQQFDWGIALKAKEMFETPIILAGGINESNIKKAIQLVNPYAVDVASGVESEPGKKDYNKLKEVIDLAK